MCKEHQQEWQAKVFYHQMQSTVQPQVHGPEASKAET
jgi:hypothetical protein